MFSNGLSVSHGSSLAAKAIIAGATLAALVGLAGIASANVVDVFQASTGFSGTQGANGWSYAGVLWSGRTNLVSNEVMASYDNTTATWQAIVVVSGTGAFVDITSTQQDMTEGNSAFSLRYWTASRHYDSVSVTGNLVNTNDVGARIVYYNATSQAQSNITGPFWMAAPPTQTTVMDASLANVNAGDRIYFEVTNYGVGSNGNDVMETWNPTITAYPSTAVPEAASLDLFAIGGVALALVGRKRRRRTA